MTNSGSIPLVGIILKIWGDNILNKIAKIVTITLSPVLLTACKANSNYSSKKQIYPASIDRISVTDNKDWKISGTSNAPDGTKVLIGVTDHDNPNFGTNSGESLKLNALPIVKNKKIEALVNPLFTVNTENEHAGIKTEVAIIPIRKYSSDWYDATVNDHMISAARKNGSLLNLPESKSQFNQDMRLTTKFNTSSDDDINSANGADHIDTDTSSLVVVPHIHEINDQI